MALCVTRGLRGFPGSSSGLERIKRNYVKILRECLLFVHCQPPASNGERHWEVKLLEATWVQALVFFVPVPMDLRYYTLGVNKKQHSVPVLLKNVLDEIV